MSFQDAVSDDDSEKFDQIETLQNQQVDYAQKVMKKSSSCSEMQAIMQVYEYGQEFEEVSKEEEKQFEEQHLEKQAVETEKLKKKSQLNDFQKKNKQLLNEIKVKKQQKQEEQEKKKLRQEQLAKKLREKTLKQIQQTKQKEEGVIYSAQEEAVEQLNKSAEAEPAADQIEQKETINKKKEKKEFLKRYEAFLVQEEIKQQKEEKKKAKLREELGINQINSKVYELTQTQKAKYIEKAQQQQKTLEEEEKYQLEMKNTEAERQKKQKDKEKQFLEKQKEYNFKQQQLHDKKIQQQIEEEEEKKDLEKKVLKVLKSHTQLINTIKETQLSEEKELRTNDYQEEDQQAVSQIKLRSFPLITDLDQWKKKQRIDPKTRIFIILGGYSDIKHALLQRNWMENPDPNSEGKDIEHSKLLPFQWANHFEKNTSITTKVGLVRNLRNSFWVSDCNIQEFFPKAFDLNDPVEVESFIQYFKETKAEAILKYYLEVHKKEGKVAEEILLKTKVALEICLRRLYDCDECVEKAQNEKTVQDYEWEILATDELTEESLAMKKHDA